MGLGGQNIDMVRRRQDAAEWWRPRDRDEALSGLGDALGALGAFVGVGEVLLRRVTPRRLRVALKHVEPACRLGVREARSRQFPPWQPIDPGRCDDAPAGHPPHQSELKRLEARGNLVPLAHGRPRPLPVVPPTRVRVARMPRPTREVGGPVSRACRGRTVLSRSSLSAVRLTQVGPPAAHQARRANSDPAQRVHGMVAASGRLDSNRLHGFGS